MDTWGWVAWAVQSDPGHSRAEGLISEIRRQSGQLVTTNFVLAEALTRLRYDFGLPPALKLADVVAALAGQQHVAVTIVDASLWADALTWFRRFDDQRLSFVDCTSFAIMEALGLREALTADRHFATAGFVPLGL